ncbi:MAG: phosphatidylglycerophosphatase A [Elusimicrobiales bacterium]
MSFLLRMLSSGFFVSYIPVALSGGRKFSGAGLLGTVEAVALLPLLPRNPAAYLVFTAAFCVFAVWVAGAARFPEAVHDNPRIVIDEIAGMWIAAALLPRTFAALGAAFVLFRFLDSAKPFGIKKLERLEGGLGIVADDVVCGLAANAAVRAGLVLFAR